MILPQPLRNAKTPPERDPAKDISETWQSGGRVVWLEWRGGEDSPIVGYKNEDILAFPPPISEMVHKRARRVKVEWPSEAFSPVVWYADFDAQEMNAASLRYNWPHTQGTGKANDEWRIGSDEDWARQR